MIGTLAMRLAAAGIVLAAATGEVPPPARRAPDLSCQNWNAQKRGRDPDLMQQLAGVWEADTVIPATPGIIGETPEHVVTTQWANGQLTYERSACFEPYGLGRSCAQSIGRGEWFAYPVGNGWFFYAIGVVGSGYHGEALPPNCGGGYYRLEDENTSVDQNGGTATRTGSAP